MSAAENKKLIEHIFDRMAEGNTQAMSESMAADFRWTFPGNWSWSGSWEPKVVVLEELLRPLMTQFTEYRSTADFIIAEDDRVVAQISGHGITTRGEPYEQTYCMIFRLANGRLTEVIEHCDTALVERVLEHPRIQQSLTQQTSHRE
ncbi:nuclear transport factor 2 family protein [Nocardia sp. KC 131]|uniref:nuclear transport factor 2 family protein n=1 Tax=Nocardia arseniciresistens TaxID=3392119 RepID=UPI00398EE725